MKRSPLKRHKRIGRAKSKVIQQWARRKFDEILAIERAAFRAQVLRAAGFHCQRCGDAETVRGLEAHHYLPRSRGGTDEPSNGFALCAGPGGCHRAVHEHSADDWRKWIDSRKRRVA